jgi:hypothetical protein
MDVQETHGEGDHDIEAVSSHSLVESDNESEQADQLEAEIEEAQISTTNEKEPETFIALDPIELKKLLERFKSVICLSKFRPEMLEAEHISIIEEFLTARGTRRLLLYIDDRDICCIQTMIPTKLPTQAMYFVRESTRDSDILTESNFGQLVQYVKYI